MGLLGVLICHILKTKGYRCTTAEPEEEEKISAEKIEMQDEAADTTNDTVGHIVSYIMKNEANADVLKAMVADNSAVADNSVFDPEIPTTPNTPVSPTSPTSPLGTPTKHSCHLHTIGGVADTETYAADAPRNVGTHLRHRRNIKRPGRAGLLSLFCQWEDSESLKWSQSPKSGSV
ncbi:unnamed protein product [Staurois parvus]|uniref:Uncharacterized protein n=1 Tax=Staurois parvus TaxID=386267 RepID=A0ABN9EN29_9NEOB|nr:unnamed protein product [Staurois parvus]